MVNIRKYVFSFAFFLLVLNCAAQQPGPEGEGDPPTRAARLSYSNGAVSMQPAGMDDWAPVEVNRPFTTGDYLYTDQSAVAELQLDSAVFRMGQVTSFGFLNLDDQVAQMKLTEGDLYFRVYNMAPGQVYEIDTPNAAVTLLGDGVYRIHVDPDANTTFVVTREGSAEITGQGQAFTLGSNQSANLSGDTQLAYDIEGAPAPDTLDQWCMQRDQMEMQPRATQYVPPSMIGYSDLNQNGVWTETPDYGPVWYPRTVVAGWAPYHMGHWVWIDPWGWTWVDTEPWAFAPSHYGRWIYWHDRWAWTPGPVVVFQSRPVRPVYAPAMVAWFGGAHWGVSIAIGGGGAAFGWVPLGWGEVYTPAYHCGPTYFRNVNVYNTRIVNQVNITNVYKTVYVQKTVYNQTFVNMSAPHAVVAMPASAMASGRSVQEVGRPVASNEFGHLREAQLVAPSVVPTRTGVAPLMGRPAAHPNQSVFARPIVAHVAQPAHIVPFEQRQAYVQQHPGQPVNFAAMRQQYQAQARPSAEAHFERQSHPVQVHVGQRVGNPPPSPRLAAQTEQGARPGNAGFARTAPAPGQSQHGLPPNRQGTPVARQSVPAQGQHEDQQRPANGGYEQSRPAGTTTGSHGLPPNRQDNPTTHQTSPEQPHYEQPNRPAQAGEAAQPRNDQPRPASAEPRNVQGEHPAANQAHEAQPHRGEPAHNSGTEHKKEDKDKKDTKK